MSKGSSPRPISVSDQEYTDRWDAIFNRENTSHESDSEQDKITRNNTETQEAKLEYISP
jgi:hypothetical protein